MRPTVVLLIFVALCMDAPLRSQAGAVPTTSKAPTEIVIISFSAAVLGTAEAQHDLDALRNKYAPRQQQLRKLNDSVEALRKMLADPAVKLTDGERSQKTTELQNQEKGSSAMLKTFGTTLKPNPSRPFSVSRKRCTYSCRASPVSAPMQRSSIVARTVHLRSCMLQRTSISRSRSCKVTTNRARNRCFPKDPHRRALANIRHNADGSWLIAASDR
jgi:hypothetical protein